MPSEDRYPMMSGGRVIVTFLLIGMAVRSSHGAFIDDEKRLRTDLFRGYEYKIRPNASVFCRMRLSLWGINLLDVTGQLLTVSAWLTVEWNDPRLKWNPSDYGGITDIFDTECVVWRPMIVVDNDIFQLGLIQDDKLMIRISSDGEIHWEPPGIFHTHCDADVGLYPFETQICVIQITSWSYKNIQVNLRAADQFIYLANYQESGEWEILDTWTDGEIIESNLLNHTRIDFHLEVRRRSTYYVMTLLFPIIVTSVLCVLVFLLPVDSSEKVDYALTILLTYVVMLTLVEGYMPPTSKIISLLSTYVTIVLFLGTFATLATVLTLFVYLHNNAEPVPDGMVILWTKVLIPVARWKKPVARSSTPKSKKSDVEVTEVYVMKDRSSIRIRPPSFQSQSENKETKSDLERKPIAVNSLVEKDASLTWQEMSIIMDAALFKVLTLFIIVLTVVFLGTLMISKYA